MNYFNDVFTTFLGFEYFSLALAAEKFAIVALCSFASLLNIYLTFTLFCLNGKI